MCLLNFYEHKLLKQMAAASQEPMSKLVRKLILDEAERRHAVPSWDDYE